jgi:hypothetical protein
MHESDTYQAILDEGRLITVKRAIVRLGAKRFGNPDKATTTAIDAMVDLQRLEFLHDRILDVKSWQELLATP